MSTQPNVSDAGSGAHLTVPWALSAHRLQRPSGSALVVWSVWLGLSITLAVSFLADRTSIPIAEDWYFVPLLTGQDADFWSWLWSQNNEHRLPLPRLVMLGILELTHGKYAAIGALNLLCLSGTAAGLMVFCARRRGRSDFADALIPAAFLSWGHSSHLLFPFLFSLVLPVMAILLIGCALSAPFSLARRTVTIFVALSLTILALCGLVGLLYVPTFAVALGYAARGLWAGRNGWPRRPTEAKILATAIALTVLLGGVYFIGYQTPPWNPPSPGFGPSLQTAVRVLALSFGVAAEEAWPPFEFLAVALAGATGIMAAVALGKRRGEAGLEAAGISVFAGTALVVSFAVGWSRAAWVPQFGIPARYALLTEPALIGCYFTWTRLSPPAAARWIPRLLAAGLLVLIPWNHRAGNTWFADWHRQGMHQLHLDIASGVPLDELARRHRPFLIAHWPDDTLLQHMQWLKDAGIAPFDKAAPSAQRPSAQ